MLTGSKSRRAPKQSGSVFATEDMACSYTDETGGKKTTSLGYGKSSGSTGATCVELIRRLKQREHDPHADHRETPLVEHSLRTIASILRSEFQPEVAAKVTSYIDGCSMNAASRNLLTSTQMLAEHLHATTTTRCRVTGKPEAGRRNHCRRWADNADWQRTESTHADSELPAQGDAQYAGMERDSQLA